MSDSDPDRLPADLTEIGDRLSASRLVAGDDVLERVKTRAMRDERPRRPSLLWASRAPRASTRKLTVAVATVAGTVAVAGVGLSMAGGPAQAPTGNAATVQYVDCSSLITLKLELAVLENSLKVQLALAPALRDTALIARLQAQIAVLKADIALCVSKP